MADASKILGCLKQALEKADRQTPLFDRTEKDKAEDNIRQDFVDALGPLFFDLYVTSDPCSMRDGIRTENLFTPRSAAFRRATYGSSDFDTQWSRLTDTFCNNIPANRVRHLRRGLQRLREDFAAQAVTSAESLIQIRRSADGSLQSGGVERAYKSYTRLLASKPYVRQGMENIGDISAEAFFLQVKMSAMWCCALRREPFEGIRLAASLTAHWGQWYIDAAQQDKDRYWIAMGLLIAKASILLEEQLTDYKDYTDAQRELLWGQTSNIERAWRHCCQHVARLEQAPWHRGGSGQDGEHLEMKNQLLKGLAAFRKLRKALNAQGEARLLPQIEKMPSLPVEDLLGERFLVMAPAQYAFSSYRSYPKNIERAYEQLWRASHGERVENRNFMIHGTSGSGKSTLNRAFVQKVINESADPNGGWGRPVRAFEMTDMCIMSSVFDGSREKIDAYFNDLVAVAEEDGFVPVVLLEEVDKYLGAQGRDNKNENEKIMHAFLSKMDSVSADNCVFIFSTTNHPRRLAKAASSRIDQGEQQESLATKANAILKSGLLHAEESDILMAVGPNAWSQKVLAENVRDVGYELPWMLSMSYFFSLREVKRCLGSTTKRQGAHGNAQDFAERRSNAIDMMLDLFYTSYRPEIELKRLVLQHPEQFYDRGWSVHKKQKSLGPFAHAIYHGLTMSADQFWSKVDFLITQEDLPMFPLMSVDFRSSRMSMLLGRNNVEVFGAKPNFDWCSWVSFLSGQSPSASTARSGITKQWSSSDLFLEGKPPADNNLSIWDDFYFSDLRKFYIDKDKDKSFDWVTFNFAILKQE